MHNRTIGGLYVIIDPESCRGREPDVIAKCALEGGARMIQWRDKRRDKRTQYSDASSIASVCRMYGALFLVNDHADLALAVGAGGLHLGQNDLPLESVRPIVGERMVIGVSTNTVEEALEAQDAGADYVAVGSIYRTASKPTTRPASLKRVAEVKQSVRIPVIAIGGINAGNVAAVVRAGADGVAVISTVCAAGDPRLAAEELSAFFGATLALDVTRGA
jgi:thiamine-phosphate pyrophosphorylase